MAMAVPVVQEEDREKEISRSRRRRKLAVSSETGLDRIGGSRISRSRVSRLFLAELEKRSNREIEFNNHRICRRPFSCTYAKCTGKSEQIYSTLCLRYVISFVLPTSNTLIRLDEVTEISVLHVRAMIIREASLFWLRCSKYTTERVFLLFFHLYVAATNITLSDIFAINDSSLQSLSLIRMPTYLVNTKFSTVFRKYEFICVNACIRKLG